MSSREEELRELYELAALELYKFTTFGRYGGRHITPRLKELLSKHTPWNTADKRVRGGILTAIAKGATLDEQGKLVLNAQESRGFLRNPAIMEIMRTPNIISPQTTKLGELREHFEIITRKGYAKRSAIEVSDSARRERGKTGRWRSRIGPRP